MDIEVERLLMQREDRQSLYIEQELHKQKFNQKNYEPPPLPAVFTLSDPEGLMKHRPLQKTPKPTDPIPDSYTKFANAFTPSSIEATSTGVRALPGKINLKNVKKVCWSKSKETAELEEERR